MRKRNHVLVNFNLLILAIFDETKIVGMLSRSSLRGLSPETIGKLSAPVLHYIQKCTDGINFLTCMPQESLKSIIERMVETRSHRIWIISDNESLNVVGVISQTDILASLVGVNHLVSYS
jgi:CBS-domain-containing membrane protein